jgi:hypothetical protein
MAARNELIKMSLTERYQQLDGHHLCTPFTLTLVALGIVAVAAIVISGAAFLASGLPPRIPSTSPPHPPLDSALDRAGGWRADTSAGADPAAAAAIPQSLNRRFYGAPAPAPLLLPPFSRCLLPSSIPFTRCSLNPRHSPNTSLLTRLPHRRHPRCRPPPHPSPLSCSSSSSPLCPALAARMH